MLAEHLETFLERTRSPDRQLPAHVEKELRAYLDCGILAAGFLRVRCEDCAHERVVAFSCQRRSFCPSCMGRRMVDTAARLVDEILPPVPVRQWVLSLPFEIRYRLAWDGKLVSAVLAVFLRVVYGCYRRQAKEQGHADGRCGSVSFVQRSGSALNLNPHYHVSVSCACCSGAGCWKRATSIRCGRRSPCWRRSPPPLCRDRLLSASAPGSGCAAAWSILKRAFALVRCALPRGGSHCTQPPTWRRRIASAWRSSVDTSLGHPWPPGVCRFWMASIWPFP